MFQEILQRYELSEVYHHTHCTYKLPAIGGYDMTLSGHIFNALDDVYVQDAVDNSKYNGYGDKLHLAHNAEVFLGTPRYYNVGLSVYF